VAFKHYDTNKSGSMSKDEFSKIIKLEGILIIYIAAFFENLFAEPRTSISVVFIEKGK
jgi:hypothetical protein